MNLTGRWVAFLAYAWVGIMVGACVLACAGALEHAIYAGLAWLIWIAAFDPSRIGMNDPHVLGMAVSATALWTYLKRGETTGGLYLSAVLFAASIFTKQSLVALPAAVGLDLLLKSRKRFGLWLAAAAGSALAFLLLTFVVDGAHFFDHLSIPRTYTMSNLLGSTSAYLFFFQVALGIAAILLCRDTLPRVLLFAFVLANLAGIVYTAGTGAGVNHLFDAVMVISIVIGAGSRDIEQLAAYTPHPALSLAVVAIVPVLNAIMTVPQRFPEDLASFRARAAAESSFESAVKFIRAQPGDALCESLLPCFEAGKRETWDAFVIGQLVGSGRLDERSVLSAVASRAFGVIELDVKYNQSLDSQEHITPSFGKVLIANYQPALRTTDFVLFTPRRN